MTKTGFARNGAIAGLASGFVEAIIIYASLPSVDEVIEEMHKKSIAVPVSEELLWKYLEVVLPISGIIAVIFMLIIGALFGVLSGYIYSKSTLGVTSSALASGILLLAFLVLPNLLFRADTGKIVSNIITGVVYTVSLVLASIRWDPLTYREKEPRLT
ncbi:MAG: hypothetical protein F7C32_01425 [Desulfurococcales archaeon]|nr:hypothetical protein [Desulfurococcales archaeon]